MKSRFSKYRSGVLFVCNSTKAESSFGAVKNATTENDLEKILKLNYEEMSKRDEDLQFAESSGRTLSMKVKTRLHDTPTAEHRILIGDILYSVLKVDSNREKKELYIYLEEERKLERGTNDNGPGRDEGDTSEPVL